MVETMARRAHKSRNQVPINCNKNYKHDITQADFLIFFQMPFAPNCQSIVDRLRMNTRTWRVLKTTLASPQILNTGRD